MPKLYLDTNIISYLQHPESYPGLDCITDLPIIQRFIEESQDVKVFYSTAHLMDVWQGYIQNQSQALEKLHFISQITRNRYLFKDPSSAHLIEEILPPKVAFFREFDSTTAYLPSDLARVDPQEFVDAIPALRLLKKVRIDLSRFPATILPAPISYDWKKQEPTLYNLISDVANSVANLFRDNISIYKKYRNQMIEETAIIREIFGLEYPLPRIFEELNKGTHGRRILRALKESMAADGNDAEDVVSGLFIFLDAVGYNRDQLKPGHDFMSVATDAAHCFHASDCDFFITNDIKAKAKARAVFHFLDLDTKVLRPKAFAAWIRKNRVDD